MFLTGSFREPTQLKFALSIKYACLSIQNRTWHLLRGSHSKIECECESKTLGSRILPGLLTPSYMIRTSSEWSFQYTGLPACRGDWGSRVVLSGWIPPGEILFWKSPPIYRIPQFRPTFYQLPDFLEICSPTVESRGLHSLNGLLLASAYAG